MGKDRHLTRTKQTGLSLNKGIDMKNFDVALVRAFLMFLLFLSPATVFPKGGSGHSSEPVYVQGHTTKSGTYVAPHYRSHPDGTTANNWSTKGNVNPFTGKAGTKSLGATPASPARGAMAKTTLLVPASTSSGSDEVPESNAPAILNTDKRSPLDAGPRIPPTISSAPSSDPLLEFQKRNALKGSPESMRAMGLRYLAGTGVEEDGEKAREFLKKAANKGDLPAQRKLRELFLWPPESP